jgi:hypothetical protein
MMGDLLMAHLPPAEGPTVLVNFGRFDDDDNHEVELPIDRARSQPYERRSISLPAPITAADALVAIRGATVGLLQATIEMDIRSEDPAVVAATVGSRGSLPAPHRQAGSGPLWREWIPPPQPSATVTAHFTKLPEGKQPAPAPAPRTPWHIRALPGTEPLAIQGGSSGGGPVRDALSVSVTLQFDPPPDEASALELVLDELFVFRRCDSDLVDVPAPRPGEAVELAGRSLACGSDRIELMRWEPNEHGTHRLVVRPSEPEIWPDVRVVAGDASASLSLRPTAGDELAGGLPNAYSPVFPAGRVTLGLRMLGRKPQIPSITIPLTPPQTP